MLKPAAVFWAIMVGPAVARTPGPFPPGPLRPKTPFDIARETDSWPPAFHPPETCSSDAELHIVDHGSMYWTSPGSSDLLWSCSHIGQHGRWPSSNPLKGWWTDHDERTDNLGREVLVFWPNSKYECGRCWDENYPGNTYDWYSTLSLDDMDDGMTLKRNSDSSQPGSETCKVVGRTACTKNTLGIAWYEYTTENVEKAIAKGGKRAECEHLKICYGSRSCCLQGVPV